MPFHFKKKLCFLFTLCLLLTFCGCGKHQDTEVLEKFQTLCTELLQEELQEDTLSLHYYFANPTAIGLKASNPSLGPSPRDLDTHHLKCFLHRLSELPKEKLPLEQQLLYDSLTYYLELGIQSTEYSWFREYLNPDTGVQIQLPMLLSEMPFYQEEDIKDYLSLLRQFPAYIEEILLFEKQKASLGLALSDEQITQTLSFCTKFSSQFIQGFLVNSFQERIQELPFLSPELRAYYIEENALALEEAVKPSYEAIIHCLEELKGSGLNELGLCYFEQGREYYCFLLQNLLGTKEDPMSFFQKIEASRQHALNQCMNLYAQNPSIFQEYETLSLTFSSEDDMLEHLIRAMQEDFPVPQITSYELTYSPKELADFLSPAYYIRPPFDDYNHNQIFINTAKEEEPLSYFATLAHEGFPGHLYQTTMTYSYGCAPVSVLTINPAFVEGWATYVELFSYQYAGLSKELASFASLNQAVILSLYATCDIGIHYLGWTQTDVGNLWKDYGISSLSTIQEISQMIINNPGNYLKYYMGYLLIDNLKKEAQDNLSSVFSNTTFHETLLRMGPAPFDIIYNYFDRYYSKSI